MNLIFKPIVEQDWKNIAQIYKQGIETGNATFETEVPTWVSWNEAHLTNCRIAAWYNNSVVGWAALSPVSSRCVYGGVAEVSVYVNTKFLGQKIGSQLVSKLIIESEENNLWTLQAGIFPENKLSIALHQKLGFRIVGYREKIGKMNNVWRDTLLLERRSNNLN